MSNGNLDHDVFKVGSTVTTLLLSAHGIVCLPVMAGDHPTEREEKRSKTKRSFKRSARGVALKLRTMRSLADSIEDVSSEEEDDQKLLVDSEVAVAQEDKVDSPDKDLTWPGKDFVNFIVKDVAEPDMYEVDNSDRVNTPRMPWHDVGLVVHGDTARDVAR